MSVRAYHARHESNHVTKKIGDKLITLYRVDCSAQPKSLLYSIMKRIESGKLDIGNEYKVFDVHLDGTLKGIIKI